MKRILLSILIIGVLLLSACAAPASPMTRVEPELILKWSGDSVKTTEPFTINNAPWVISWANNPKLYYGRSMGSLQIMVYNAKNPDVPIALAANLVERGSATSYIYETGTFYLDIVAANTKWAVHVWVWTSR